MVGKFQCSEIENISILKTNQENMCKYIEKIDKKLDTIIEKADENNKIINDKFDALEKKFAWKWVENVWYFVFIAIWWAVLTAVIQLIIK